MRVASQHDSKCANWDNIPIKGRKHFHYSEQLDNSFGKLSLREFKVHGPWQQDSKITSTLVLWMWLSSWMGSGEHLVLLVGLCQWRFRTIALGNHTSWSREGFWWGPQKGTSIQHGAWPFQKAFPTVLSSCPYTQCLDIHIYDQPSGILASGAL